MPDCPKLNVSTEGRLIQPGYSQNYELKVQRIYQYHIYIIYNITLIINLFVFRPVRGRNRHFPDPGHPDERSLRQRDIPWVHVWPDGYSLNCHSLYLENENKKTKKNKITKTLFINTCNIISNILNNRLFW